MTTYDDHPVEHNPLASMPHDTHGGISNPVLGMLLFITSEVMFFGGLFAAYFNIRANADQWPTINPETGHPFHLQVLPIVTENGVTTISFVLIATILLVLSSVHLPVRDLEDPDRRPDAVHPGDGGHDHPRHRLPADAADRLRDPGFGGAHPRRPGRTERPTSRSPGSTARTSSVA